MSIFSKSNMVIKTEKSFMKFNGVEIKLPFYFHIKDIPTNIFDEEKENIIEDYSSEFIEQQDNDDKRNEFIKLLSFVDLKQYTFDDDCDGEYKDEMTKTKNGYVFNSHESLYSFLIQYLNFNDADFQELKLFIIENQYRLISNFSKMVEDELLIGSKTEECTESFMELRSAFELNKPPVFEENIGKCVSQHSFRETKLQRIYLARKCEIDKIQYDKMMKKNK